MGLDKFEAVIRLYFVWYYKAVSISLGHSGILLPTGILILSSTFFFPLLVSPPLVVKVLKYITLVFVVSEGSKYDRGEQLKVGAIEG
ncbi:hypothetical protein Tsubulata_008771 [Turnera subulata]|uniref:Uncharacterized protein n=1 Tax=Turnera subulata TaxID=218843 RepID=A0A9Q0GCP9_9ROSI|nr:hypothetical protein Tsubulata_008771 [Turnera subulata]